MAGSAIFALVALTIFISLIYTTFKNGISPMPTSSKVQRELLKLIPKEYSGLIFDLGSGWGSLARSIAKRCPQAQVVGFETSPFPFLISFLFRRKNLKFLFRDFFKEDLSKAGMLICYLYPGAMQKIGKNPNQILITHTFASPHLSPYFEQRVGDIYQTKIYVYVEDI